MNSILHQGEPTILDCQFSSTDELLELVSHYFLSLYADLVEFYT